jgi:transcriptional regulator GlxA family with amidase domain
MMRVYHASPRIAAILALEGMLPFEIATAWDILKGVGALTPAEGYDVRLCGPEREIDAGGITMRVRHGLRQLASAHTIVVPGIRDPERPTSNEVIRALQAAARRGARIASICTGAFVLAQAGVLDGKRATTHWRMANELARRYPAIEVDPNVLYIESGQILTSAGFAAGLDLCLYLVRRDFGAAIAGELARAAVMPLERAGGQSQFISHAPPAPDGGSLERLLHWLEHNLEKPLTLGSIARRAGMSARTLSRRFREQIGTTPLKWLQHARVRRAQYLLETTDHSVDAIAAAVGFGSASTLRERFRRVAITSPRDYRRAFRVPMGRAST